MKYKINRNQAPLTDSDLNPARNFNQLLHSYRGLKIPFYRSGKFFASGSAIIVAAAVALIVLFDHTNDEPAKKDFISPPVSTAVIPTDSFLVDADSLTDIAYHSGSKLHIPAGAFKEADGSEVKGKVVLKYREFHDQKDIFLSGIPMTYDSAGERYVFESAGMMEITAFQDGKPLLANADKPIKVDMVSNTKEDHYNTYYLDTVEKKWININQSNLDPKQFEQKGSDTSATVAQPLQEMQHPSLAGSPELSNIEKEVNQKEAAVKEMEKEKPMPIAKADKSKTKFHIVVDAGEFPEIAIYKGVRFQVVDEKSFDPAKAKVEWEDVKLKKLTGINYEVAFSKGSEVFKVIATPVIDDKDMAEAQKIYDRKFAEYEARLTEKKEAEEKAKRDYEARAKEMEAQMQKAIAEQKERDRLYEASLSRSQIIYRTFSVYRFGTYNCDSPVQWPNEAKVIASLTTESGEKLKISSLSLVEKDRNAVFAYVAENGECKGFKFNPAKDNVLWAVTDDNKLAVVDTKNFKEQQSSSGRVQFRFRLIDQEFKTCADVRKYLDL